MAAVLKPHVTAADYLAAERTGKTKHEYVAGQVYAMAGASERHNLVAGNTFASLHAQLRRRSCNVYPSDMRVKTRAMGLYTYPDLSIVCGTPQFEDERRDTLLNPTVIVEVLSPTTESYDRGRKFQHYRTMPSLVEYVLVAQDAMHIEQYTRQADGRWVLTEADGPQGVIELTAIGCTLRLDEVYEKVEFAEGEA